MFNFTTLTVYNDIVVSDSTTRVPGANVIVAGDDENPEIRIGNTRFNADDIISIEVKKPTPEALASVTFDFAEVLNLVQTGSTETAVTELQEGETALDTIDGTYRFVFYIGLSMNSQDAFYSNAFVYKGKPLFIEFPIKKDDEPSDIVKRIAAIAKKYQLMVSQEKVLDITTDTTTTGAGTDNEVTAGTITFTGINGYQLIQKVVLQKFDPDANKIDCCSTTGDFVDLMYGVPVIYTVSDGVVTTTEEKLGEDGEGVALADNEVPIAPGLEAFCDYNWLIHNLRLPTAANTSFWSFTNQLKEMPAPGTVYTQFIIRMCKERDGIAGHVVGHRATSVTTHVMYVAGNCAKNPSTTTTPADKLYKLLNTLASSKIAATADTALADPFKLS